MFQQSTLRYGRFFVIAIAIWTVVCYGGTSLAATRSPRTMQPAASSFVYGCAFDGNFCNIYVAGSGKLIQTVTTGLAGPAGIAVDSEGRWFVANSSMRDVLVFAAGRTLLVSTLDDAGEFPGDIALGRRDIAVSNTSGVGSTPGSVSVYRRGTSRPAEVLHYAAASEGVGVSFDFYGNCYWSFTLGTKGGDIVEFPKCSADSTPIDLNLAIASPGGLAFDQKHDLWYVDRTAGLFECQGVKSCKLVASGFVDPYLIRFDAHDSDLYLMDAGYGIYRISGIGGPAPLRVRPMSMVTPFAAISPSAVPSGVGAGMAP